MKFWKEIRKKKEKLKLGPTRLSGTRQKMNIKTLISFVYFLEWKKSRSSLRWCSRALELRWCSKLCSLLKEMIGFLFKNLKMIMCHCSEMLQKNAIKCLEFHHLPFTLESENIGILRDSICNLCIQWGDKVSFLWIYKCRLQAYRRSSVA